MAGAENDARYASRDTQLDMLGRALQIGRGISGSASEGLSSAAGMANAREETYKGQKAQHRQNLVSTGATAAGLAIAFL